MKRVLERFDPRKSYQGAGPKDKNNIFVVGVDNDGYTPENLSQALVAAAKLASSRKETEEVSVILPPLDIAVKGALTIPKKVVLIGQVESSRGDNAVPEKRSGTRLILSSNAYISQGGGFGELRNLLIQLPSKYEPDEKVNAAAAGILIPSSATLAINDCIFQVDDGVKPVGERLGAHVLGALNVKGCFFNAVRLLFEVSSSGSVEDSVFSNFNCYESEMPAIEKSIAVSIFSQPQPVILKNVDVSDYFVGLYIEASQKCSVTGCKISGKRCAVDVCNSETTFTGCNISSLEGRGLKARGNVTSLTVLSTVFTDSAVGLSIDGSAAVKLDNCSILNCSMCGIRVEGSAVLDMTNSSVSNAGLVSVGEAKADGLQIISGGSVNAKKCSVKNFSGSGVICQDEHSMFDFDDIDISNNKVGGMFASEGSSIKGKGGQFNDNEGQTIAFRHGATTGDIQGAKIKGGKVGIVVMKGPICKFKELRLEDLSDKCVFISDATVTICQAQISQQNTNGVGIEVKFKTDKRNIVTLQHCKIQKCKEGIRVEQVLNKKNKSNELEDGGSIGRINPGSDIESRCEIENAAFVQCEVGFYVDAARVNLKGCSFIMNKKHSLYIVNQTLRPGQNIRKEANLKVRWPNYVEPYIDNGDNVSNDHQLLTSVTKEKSFCGSADFEPMMYISTLTERIRQARTLFKSKEKGGLQEARVIMISVSHMLLLFRQLPPRLLDKELNDDPDLGMFAATFKLHEDKEGPTNTLVSIKDLFTSWQSLHRTRLFDSALQALNEAFQEKQVSEELYDQCVTPLEEMQRVCFVKSKYNRRRDYLLTTARETPLTTWYFLDKESPDTEEGRRLRDEVLKFLAADKEDNRVHNKTNFHASWVAQWAVHVLGQSFLDSPIPDDLYLRKAWANVLLDARQAKKVLEAYEKITSQNQQQEVDELIRFECFRMYEDMGNQLTQTQLSKLGTLLGGNGFAAAMQVGAKLFPGEGALPGFLRRVAEEAMNPESLLEPLSNIQDVANQLTRKQKERVVLAVMSHHILPDSKIEPEIYRRHGTSYETCEMCLVQKLQPWNEIKLEGCKHNHRYCRPCMKQSMSTGSQELWGICPGTTDEGKPCPAMATRREMELAGMDRELIYNIIRKRVTQTLQRLPEWKPCDAPGCIGGRSNVTKTFYSCRLCTKMITIDGGASDPTVPKRLLQGLDGSAVMRGEGVFRECYWCSVTYEKGNACSTITCSNCNKQFSMTWGPERITHRFDEEGIGPQRYVPKVAGKLWELGVFKDRKGKPLKLGQTLTEVEAVEVVRRAKLQIAEYTD